MPAPARRTCLLDALFAQKLVVTVRSTVPGRQAAAARALVADPLKAHMFAQALALRRQQVGRMRRVASLLENRAKLRSIRSKLTIPLDGSSPGLGTRVDDPSLPGEGTKTADSRPIMMRDRTFRHLVNMGKIALDFGIGKSYGTSRVLNNFERVPIRELRAYPRPQAQAHGVEHEVLEKLCKHGAGRQTNSRDK